MHRDEDVSGVSGTGTVAAGVELPSGRVVIEWLREPSGIVIYRDMGDAISVHGHEGRTRVVWVD